MNHIERIDAVLSNNPPDRTPVSFWRHFFHMETTAEGLAKAMIDFHNKYDWDLMKVNPRAAYHVEAWGAELKFSGDEFIKPAIIKHPVNKSSDWEAIGIRKPDHPAFDEQLKALELISGGLDGSAYFLQTMFNPISIAGDLVAEPDLFIKDMETKPDLIHNVLENITESLIQYGKEILNTGAAGLFYATTEWATTNTIPEDLYLEFGKPYDLKVLESVENAKFNILHVCKSNNMLPLFKEYPFDVLSYSDKEEGNLQCPEACDMFPGKVILGGLGAKTVLLNGSTQDVVREAELKINQIPNERFILGPSCSIPAEVPDENLRAIKKLISGK
ncbi:MAG: hypothetical protein GY855_10200 [candidate division Zixibacteria bacterium]|nr:hypothetical protein [candidate division Zixibacteria bacterium]